MDTSEQGLERLICIALTGDACEPPKAGSVREAPGPYGGVGWSAGSWLDYDREHCFDLVQLTAFLRATQPEASESLRLTEGGPVRRRFLARLQGEISKRGTIDVLRHEVSHGPHDLKLVYGSPSEGNETARERFDQNRFTVTRQLRYSRDETQRALDIALFINGLPVFTFTGWPRRSRTTPNSTPERHSGNCAVNGPSPGRTSGCGPSGETGSEPSIDEIANPITRETKEYQMNRGILTDPPVYVCA